MPSDPVTFVLGTVLVGLLAAAAVAGVQLVRGILNGAREDVERSGRRLVLTGGGAFLLSVSLLLYLAMIAGA